MSKNIYTISELIEQLEVLNSQQLPAKLLAFGWHSSLKSIIDLLQPEVLLVSELNFNNADKEPDSVADLNTAYLQVDSRAYLMVFEPITLQNLFRKIFSRSETFLALEVTDDKFLKIIDKTFADLQVLTDYSNVFAQIEHELKQLKQSIAKQDVKQFEQLLFSPYLQACCPLLIKQIEHYQQDSGALSQIAQNIEFEHKLVRLENQFVLTYKAIKDLINEQTRLFGKLTADAMQREFVIHYEFLPRYKQLYKQKLLKEIFLLKRLVKKYPELQDELDKKEQELKEMEQPKKSPLCELFKLLGKLFKNDDNKMYKELATQLHPDRLDDNLSEIANELMQRINALAESGGVNGIMLINKLLNTYSFNSKAQGASQVDFQYAMMLKDLLEFAEVQTAMLSVKKELITKSLNEIRTELQQELDELQKQIQALENQLQVIQ